MSKLASLHRWRQTRAGLLIAGLAELLAVFGFASWAIDSGRLLAYFLGIVFLVGTLQNIVKLARTFIRGPKRQTTKA